MTIPLTSLASTIEALENAYGETLFISDLFSESLKMDIIAADYSEVMDTAQQINDLITDRETLEFDEIVDLKAAFFQLAQCVTSEDVETGYYDDLQTLYRLAFLGKEAA